MNRYVTMAACNGRRPKKVGPARIHSRQRLMKKLVSERDVARFVMAPSGFGKTSLALEYASSMFSFRDVYWFDCQNHCFLRDLDDETLAAQMTSAPEPARLAVFDDVPYLDDARLAKFAAQIDVLLDAGCEVLASTTPAFDALARCQRDSIEVGARDLLVDDAELSASKAQGISDKLRECDRVPAFVWGGPVEMREFLRGMRPGEMPAEMRAPMFVMEALQTGSFDDLSVVTGGVRADARKFISEHYPYVGIDLAEETFEVHELPVEQVVEGMGDSADGLGRMAGPPARDALSAKVACMLASRGLGARACEVMRVACARKRRISWLAQQQWPLFDGGCVRPVQELFDSLGARGSGVDASMLASAALRMQVLAAGPAAATFSRRALSFRNACAADEFICRMVLAQEGVGPEREAAIAWLKRFASEHDASATTPGVLARAAAASMAYFAEGDMDACVRALGDLQVDFAPNRASVLHLAAMLERTSPTKNTVVDVDGLVNTGIACMRAFIGDGCAPSLCEALLAQALYRHGIAACEDNYRAGELDAIALCVAGQRSERAIERRHVTSAPAAQLSSVNTPKMQTVPEMRVSVFGGMEVFIGGQQLDPRAFARQRTKTLLTVLVLARGKEVPRSKLLQILWPESTEERALNNFYSLWCRLRRTLVPDDAQDCPYLVRHKASVMVDARYVRSDVDEFEELCHRLFFEEPNASAWLALYERMEEDFSSDLLPSETANPYVCAMRERFRTKRVDAYVAAASRLCDAGEPAAALWFARTACECSPNREDAAFALMRAQALSGQRTQAMGTFLTYRDNAVESLGIDPPERMRTLYSGLLEDISPNAA